MSGWVGERASELMMSYVCTGQVSHTIIEEFYVSRAASLVHLCKAY